MAIKVGDFTADYHSFHHVSLGTDLKVIQKQSAEKAKNGSVIVHHHLSDQPCKDREHESYAVTTVLKAA